MTKRLGGLLLLLLLLSACGTVGGSSPAPTPVESPAAGALTPEELRWFNEVFFKPDITNIRNVFGSPYGSTYEAPQDIDLARLFGDSDLAKASEEEVRALLRQGSFQDLLGEDGAYICPVFRMTAGEMDRVLLKYTGLTLEETDKVGLEGLPYLDGYDAYYWCRGDAGYPGPLTVLDGIREGSTVTLYQQSGDGRYCLTLEQQPDGNYWFVSNLPE